LVNRYLFDYLIVFIDFMLVVLVSMVVFSLMQGTGDTLTPTIILVTMNLLNIIFNWFLIPGPEVLGLSAAGLGLGMGIKGAAVGTVCSRLIGCVIAFSLIFSGRYRVDMRKAERFLPSWIGMLPVLRIGLPSAFQFISRNISVMLLNYIISFSMIKEKAHAVLNTGFLIEWLPFGPAMAMMQASAIIVGQNIGAGRIDRAQKAAYTAFGFAFWVMCLNALLFWFYPDKLAMIFTNDEEVVASLAMYLRIIGICDIFLAALVFAGAVRAAGDALTPMLINVISIWAIRIPFAWVIMFYTNFDDTGVWFIMGFSQVVQGIALFFAFRIGRWKRINLIARKVDKHGAP